MRHTKRRVREPGRASARQQQQPTPSRRRTSTSCVGSHHPGRRHAPGAAPRGKQASRQAGEQGVARAFTSGARCAIMSTYHGWWSRDMGGDRGLVGDGPIAFIAVPPRPCVPCLPRVSVPPCLRASGRDSLAHPHPDVRRHSQTGGRRCNAAFDPGLRPRPSRPDTGLTLGAVAPRYRSSTMRAQHLPAGRRGVVTAWRARWDPTVRPCPDPGSVTPSRHVPGMARGGACDHGSTGPSGH